MSIYYTYRIDPALHPRIPSLYPALRPFIPPQRAGATCSVHPEVKVVR